MQAYIAMTHQPNWLLTNTWKTMAWKLSQMKRNLALENCWLITSPRRCPQQKLATRVRFLNFLCLWWPGTLFQIQIDMLTPPHLHHPSTWAIYVHATPKAIIKLIEYQFWPFCISNHTVLSSVWNKFALVSFLKGWYCMSCIGECNVCLLENSQVQINSKANEKNCMIT